MYAIMFCPYCGAPEPDTEELSAGYGDSFIVWCMTCGEQCLIERNTEDDEEGEDE